MKENQATPIYVLTLMSNNRTVCAGESIGDIVDFLIEKQVLRGHSRAWPIDKFGIGEYYTAPLEAIYGVYWEERVRAMSRSEFNMSFADDFHITVVPMWHAEDTEDGEDENEDEDEGEDESKMPFNELNELNETNT